MSSGLMGGEKTRSLFTKYVGVGEWKGGVIIEPFPKKEQQTDYDTGEPLWWDKEQTQPKEHIVVTLQTDERDPEDPEDTGVRRVYLKGGDHQKKTAAAVTATGADDFEIGARYFSCRTGYGKPRQNAAGHDLNAPWLYEVDYARPAKGSGLNDGGNTGGNKRNGDTVLDRSQARQAEARQTIPPSPLSGQKPPADDDKPPF